MSGDFEINHPVRARQLKRQALEIERLEAKVANLEAENSTLRYVVGVVQCEFEEGTWQRRDIDAALVHRDE